MAAALSKRDIEMIFRAETDAATRPVNELTADVKRLRTTLEDLAKTGTKTDKSLDTLATTTRELEKAQSELANARVLLTQLNAQATALERAESNAEKAAKKFGELKTQVDSVENPTKRLTTSMEAAERKMAAANQRLEEQRGIYREVKTSIESIIGPVDNLQTAFRTVAVAQRDISQGLAAAKGSVASFKAEITDTKVEAERLAQVDAFRKFAADSVAADSAATRISSALDSSTTSARRLADAVLGIVNPAQAAATTLAGIDERLDAVVARTQGGLKKISVPELGEINNDLAAIQAGLLRVSNEVDNFVRQQSRVDDVAAAYDAQAAKVKALATAEVQAGASVAELTAELKREQSQLIALGETLDRETQKLSGFSAGLKRVGVDSSNIPAAIQRIEQSARRAAPAIQDVTNVLSPRGRKGFLGLDPFQLQNLSYQINDVFTSLGSGAPPLQVFAQQSGQILQIFPGILSNFARALPIILPLAAGFAVLAGSLSEANAQLETTRTASTVLASLGEANGYDPAKFRQIVDSFRDLGVSLEEATASAKTFVTEGLNPAAVDDFIIAAKNLADVQGIDVKTATEELTKAFTSGATEVLALDDKYKFLTDTQRDNIAASKDTGREHDEVRKAFTQLYNKMQEGATAARGPMTDATNTLRAAWRGLLSTFADTGILTSVIGVIEKAILGLTFMVNLAKRVGVVFKGAGDAYAAAGGGVLGTIAAGAKIGANIGSGNYEKPIDGAYRDTLQQMRAQQIALNRAQQAAGADPGLGSRGRQRDRESQAAKDRKQAERDRKKAAREAEAEAKRRQREAEQLERQYQNEQDQLQSALSRFTAEALRNSQAPLSAQLDMAKQAVEEQFRALEDRLAEFRDKFGPNRSINGRSQTEFAEALEFQKQQIIKARQLAVYESNVNDLMKSRSEQLKTIQEDQAAGLITSQQALDKTQQVVDEMGPKLNEAISLARAFISSLSPSAETQALLDKFDRITSQNGNGFDTSTIVRQQAKTGVSKNEKDINDLFERRAALIQSANNLYEAGAINYTEREDQIRLAYEATNKEIRAGIDAAKAYLEANGELLPPDVLSNAIAQLALFNTQLTYTSELSTKVRDSARDAIANGITSMFDTLASGLADLATGTKSVGEFFEGLGRAALQFAADFAKAIAQAIIQIYALKVAKSLIGASGSPLGFLGLHGGGTVGDLGGGRMNLKRDVGIVDLASVPRYHQGTAGAGLKSDEMMAVLRRGEKVQTEEQQASEARRLTAAKKGSAASGGLRQVLAFGDEEVAGAMAGRAGEEVVVTHIRRNRPKIRQALGLD